MSTPAKKKVKKKNIRDVEIGDHVRETASSRGKALGRLCPTLSRVQGAWSEE